MALPAVIGGVLVTLARIWLASIIGRVLLTIGIGLFAYTYAVPSLTQFVGAQFSALPAFVRHSVGASGIDVVCTAVLSALAVKATARVFFGKVGGG